MQFEETMNYDVMPWLLELNYGLDANEYSFEFEKEKNEMAEVRLENEKVAGGTYSVNQVRIERGDMPFPSTIYDEPQLKQIEQGTENNPLNVRNME